MKLVEWIAKAVTDDPRALEWFAEEGSDERIAKAFQELLAGYALEPSTILKTTRMLEAGERPGMVEVKGIEFHSLCAHHFLPFFGDVDVCYEPGDRILGLGKLPRLVDAYARRFQIQEDLVRQVAEEMMSSGRARGVRVRSQARHLCMCSRGPSSQGASRTPSLRLARWRRTERTRAPLPALALVVSLLVPAGQAASAAETAGAPGSGLAFARGGEVLATLDLAALRRFAEPATLRVREPYEDGEAEFEALPLAAVLDGVYGRSWRNEEELLFTCRDGYQPTVPVARAKAHRAWLAFRRVGRPDFTIQKRESGVVQTIDLGPFYLIWENLDDEQVLVEADYGWPYQIVGIDLIRSAERFPRLAPPGGASPQVRAGFDAFRIHCSKCHQLNGEGGSIGPELNAPGAPLADRDPAWLRTWIESPDRIRPNSRMPALNPKLPDRDQVVDDLIAYLNAMVGSKVH